MALINPVHGLVVPFLCVFTIPLAIFAGITTTFAFSVLMFRVAVVYIDIALALIPQYFTGRGKVRSSSSSHQHSRARDGFRTPISPPCSVSSGSGYSTPSPVSAHPSGGGYLSSSYHTPRRRKSSYGFGAALRSRRSSQVSLASIGTITPIHEDEVAAPVTESGLTPSVGMDRDFEGIGGWRLDEQGDEAAWTQINSRLELPQERTSISMRHHHQRSQSAGPSTPSEASWMVFKTMRGDRSPERRDWEKMARSPGAGLVSPGNGRRSNQNFQMSTPMTALGQEHGYFPEHYSTKPRKKSTP